MIEVNHIAQMESEGYHTLVKYEANEKYVPTSWALNSRPQGFILLKGMVGDAEQAAQKIVFKERNIIGSHAVDQDNPDGDWEDTVYWKTFEDMVNSTDFHVGYVKMHETE